MNLGNKSQDQGFEIARCFLQTAVVVDDEAQMMLNEENGKVRKLAPPGRSQVPSQNGEKTEALQFTRRLNAGSIINSFSELGIVCGVVGPTDSVIETMRQADIVVLDWYLKPNDSKYALELLRKLLSKEEDRNSLRLVAIYTGEPTLDDIGSKVCDELADAKLEPSAEDETKTTISYRHGRVVIYAKFGAYLAKRFENRSVAEKRLPKKLVQDFAIMTSGLLPSIALTSLTAVREGEHRVLDQFCSDLDSAFLTHRVCLPDPADAERQLVNNIGEELRGLMDSAVADKLPAGDDAIEQWIKCKAAGNQIFKFGKKRQLKILETIELAKKGLVGQNILGKNEFKGLTAGFSGLSVADAEELDKRLAWIMSFRTVNDTPPFLWLGTVVTKISSDGKDKHLICMRPRCDSVRLNVKEYRFLFLPLQVDTKKSKHQIVVKINDNFERLGIGFKPEGWVHRQFEPDTDNRPVTATKSNSSGEFKFKDTRDKRYVWRGELKAEFAQRIAQILATELSRVAVDESEWLRRMANRG